MISLIIIAIIGFGIWLYFKLMNETTPTIKPNKSDFKTTLHREIEKLKDK
ncbi:MAG: hypothetical protein H8E60_06695 [Candidatus Marinimicrobia bacterium]|nr:hypothetical protein [Candidatus Neomarinimicrobiota bacterium]